MGRFTGRRLLSLLMFAAVITASRAASLAVNIGRSASLQPQHISFIPPGVGPCRIEVVTKDPMSERVGTLRPPIFDCDFAPNRVVYHHNGSPMLDEDRVTLLVYVFGANETLTAVSDVIVRVVKVPHELVVPGHQVRVDKFFGLSNPIDASVIRFRYARGIGAACTVGFSRFRSRLPLLGHILDADDDDRGVDAMREDCDEFLKLGLRYKHLSPPSPDVDYLPLEVQVLATSGEVQTERFYLPIHIDGAFPNTPPGVAFASSLVLDADEFVLTPLDAFVLKAKDGETPAGQLVFNVTSPPSLGHFVRLSERTRPITAFRQKEVTSGEIAYAPPMVSFAGKKVFTAQLVVIDSHFAASETITLHIAIHPSSSTAPRVYTNAGLTVLEGHSRPITADNLRVVDRDNLHDVRVSVRGGLRHGRLEVNGTSATWFSTQDILHGRVVYHHDDSDSPRDSIMLRISDGDETTRIMFPIAVLQRDDSPPYLVNNVGLVVTEGGYVQITPNILSAHDADSEDASLVFVVLTEPSAGELVKRLRPLTLGHKVDRFAQDEISRGYIHYHHFGGETFGDSFEFQIVDSHEPPNKSGKQRVTVHVTPDNDMPPRQVAASQRHLATNESQWVALTSRELEYTDAESDDDDLVYTVTTPPYFLKSAMTSDAGRIVDADALRLNGGNATTLTPLTEFTQRQVNHGKVAYAPPGGDIGTLRRHVQFVFSVADKDGNSVFDQTFDVTILPVNNLAPRLTVRELMIREGGSVKVTASDISAYDRDTDHAQLTFSLTETPTYGQLLKNEKPMAKGDEFLLTDLTSDVIRYVHDGSSVEKDSFVVGVSDGANEASTRVPIRVRLVDDELPRALQQREHVIEVAEGGVVVLTTANLAATDPDTEDGVLTYTVLQSPQYGRLEIDGRAVRQFSQHDVWERLVSYVHSGGESGPRPTHDRVTFSLTDRPSRLDGQVVALNITIVPVDTESPTVLPGSPLFVNECERAPLTPAVISAHDADTTYDRLSFVIYDQPEWGFIENTTPNPGSEIPNSGVAVSTFTLRDVRAGRVNYVQANCSGVEPQQDRIGVHATDGVRHSRRTSIDVIIVPTNDERPVFELASLTVDEGGETVIGPRMINASDGDEPAERLTLSVVRGPGHGRLVLLKHVPDSAGAGGGTTPLQEVAVYDLMHNTYIVYQHDGSEAPRDSFTLRVSDGRHDVTRTADVHVRAHNDEPVRLVRNRALQVAYGGTRVLSTRVLKAVDADNDDSQLYYVLLGGPERGSLEARGWDGEWRGLGAGDNFTQDDVGRNAVRYVHTRALGEAMTDEFRFRVTDGVSAVEQQTFTVRFPKGDGIALLTAVMRLAVSGRAPVNTRVLSASDETNQPQDIVFNVTVAPRHGRLTTNRQRHLATITRFTQLDLAAQVVYYEHTGSARDETDSFQFVVTNSQNATRAGEVQIVLVSTDRVLPTLDVNVPLTVPQGERANVTAGHLHVTDPDTAPARLMYSLAEPPHLGRLLRDHRPLVDDFSQLDIDSGRIVYQSERRDDLGMDYFLFNVTDLRGGGGPGSSEEGGYLINGTRQTKPAFFSILIQPPAALLPRLVVNRKPELIEDLGEGRHGFVLDARYLKATHGQTAPSDILYTLLQRPRRGELEHTTRGRTVRRRFTQQDVNSGQIVYVLNESDDDDKSDVIGDAADQTTNDMFRFRVQDRSNTALDNQKFELQWSRVQFSESQLTVCEDVGTLSLSVTRKGLLAQSAFVDIEARGRSATEHDDFRPSRTAQLQFDPGVQMVTWTLDIVKDNLEEETEKLKVQLKNPVNAVLGSPQKTVIYIVNLHRGRCAQYLGMISKTRPRALIPLPKVLPGGDVPHGTLARSKTSTLRTYHSIKAVNENSDKNGIKTHSQDMKAFGQLDKASKRTTSKHPLRAHRERGKKRNRKRKHRKNKNKKKKNNKKKHGKRGSRNRRFGRSFLAEQPDTSPVAADWPNQMAPQSCDRDSRGLLYSDLRTSQTYRCNGRAWVKWDNAVSYLIPDSRAQPPTPAPSTIPHPWAVAEGNASTECQNGWEQHAAYGCYKLMARRATWVSADEACRDAGGHLTEAVSLKHLQWISAIVRNRHFWLGLNDRKKRFKWTYTSGASTQFKHWKKGFPTRQPSLAKSCALVVQRLRWVNRVCDKNKAKFVCSATTV